VGQRVFGVAAAVLVALSLAWLPAVYGADTKTDKIPAAPVPWNKIPASEQKVLAPLQKDWPQLPAVMQRRMVTAAKQYPKLAPVQQERFQERMRDWAALTPEQRRAARDKYKDLSKLPPDKQDKLREKWNSKSSAAVTAPATTANTPPPASAK